MKRVEVNLSQIVARASSPAPERGSVTRSNVRLLQGLEFISSSILLLAVFLFTGCANFPRISATVQNFGPSYHPSNVYLPTNSLPARIRRVAVLPLSASGNSDLFEAGVETLEPLLHAELGKTKRFEVVFVTGAQMNRWTGRTSWRMDESLPSGFFTNLCNAIGCDAVLFCQLTRYQPYQPPAIGWKFNLIETPKGDLPSETSKGRALWAVDELLDAGHPSVANAARAYYIQHIRNEGPAPDPSTILSSPTRFGQYTLSTLFETLPEPATTHH